MTIFHHEMTKEPPKRLGRPPIAGEAMTAAERQRRHRAKIKPRQARVKSKPRPGDRALVERLEILHRAFEADKDFPDVVAVWETIERISANNRKLLERGEAANPFPEWVNDYLLRSADKISRLWLGIRPEDDRPKADMSFDEVGGLRRVRQGGDFAMFGSITLRRHWDLCGEVRLPFSAMTGLRGMLIISGYMTTRIYRRKIGGQLSIT